jgi:hypothetical protein
MSTQSTLIGSIRALQKETEPFWIELSNGRVIQIYHPATVAINETAVGILWTDTGFEMIRPEAITAVGNGIHAKELEKREKRLAEFKARLPE